MDSVEVLLLVLLAVLLVQRMLELRVAKRNEAWARDQGATEFGAGHYPLFFVLHGGWMVGWLMEGWSSATLPELWWAWVGVFGLAQGLRYWAIGTLGRRWNTRVLVLAGRAPIARGPYRFLPHPNYLAVALELAAVPLAVGASWTAVVATFLNAALLLGIRIPCEVRALRWATEATPAAPEEA
ncbi:MAG: isoprenylcysteine carboxyl methyltransferase family protein [Nannocystales bacterium]